MCLILLHFHICPGSAMKIAKSTLQLPLRGIVVSAILIVFKNNQKKKKKKITVSWRTSSIEEDTICSSDTRYFQYIKCNQDRKRCSCKENLIVSLNAVTNNHTLFSYVNEYGGFLWDLYSLDTNCGYFLTYDNIQTRDCHKARKQFRGSWGKTCNKQTFNSQTCLEPDSSSPWKPKMIKTWEMWQFSRFVPNHNL